MNNPAAPDHDQVVGAQLRQSRQGLLHERVVAQVLGHRVRGEELSDPLRREPVAGVGAVGVDVVDHACFSRPRGSVTAGEAGSLAAP